MNTSSSAAAVVLLAILSATNAGAQSPPPYACREPLSEPRLLAEGIISTPNSGGIAFTPDGTTGRSINFAHSEYCASISPDGKYLFFERGEMGIYQVDLRAALSDETAVNDAFRHVYRDAVAALDR